MTSNKLASFAGAILFLLLALVSLYRLLFWFPITIGNLQVGQVASFFAVAIFAALSLMMFRGVKMDH